ncbi:MraY family glycosyltransferase [Phyllobacterium bourgognense]|uniref:UDP-GlcNAc:undecaprenyl-phosphate GlcNAc-1-phosphate transferase n=1 Tax=Phyllobacterium bourgognense TaxID=314236 RepID=A0A368Z5B8_9HYPH|nr:MraY family glycosyltransferase [Phyllobacterium bourgognense]RCW87645.1 UDP-GlcNAc:undecaprenyl-phosphate GlcNAc-1-phosphate transferase [Phyllobacterium bourgognense]
MFVWITNCLAAMAVSALLIVVLKKVSHACSLVDYPDRRKLHDGVVPLCGGIAIFAAFAMVMLVQGNEPLLALNFWVGLLITIIVGVIDDRHELSATKRLAAQFVAAIILVNPLSGSTIVTGIALPPALLDISFLLLTVVAILFVVGLINSWNMIDGIDGLAGGSAAVALFWLAVVAGWKGAGELVLPIVVLLAAVSGFLAFNMRSPWVARAKIFLGDAGSTTLGAAIAYLVIRLSTHTHIAFSVLLWIVAIPVIDTLSLIVRRLYAGRSPLAADRSHLHHLLLDRSISPRTTTNIILAASALCGAIGCFGIIIEASNYLMTVALLLPLAVHSAFVFLASEEGTDWVQQSRSVAVAQLNPIPPTPIRAEIGMAHTPQPPSANNNTGMFSDAV